MTEKKNIHINSSALGNGTSFSRRLLIFVKGSCPTCSFLFPYLQKYFQPQNSADIGVWLISQDNAETTRDWIRAFGITIPVITDAPKFELSRQLKFYAVPNFVMLDGQDNVLLQKEGFIKSEFEEIFAEISRENDLIPFDLFKDDPMIPVMKPG